MDDGKALASDDPHTRGGSREFKGNKLGYHLDGIFQKVDILTGEVGVLDMTGIRARRFGRFQAKAERKAQAGLLSNQQYRKGEQLRA